MYDVCPKCKGKLRDDNDHHCPPAWKCWLKEDGEDDNSMMFYAWDVDYAVEQFVKYIDQDSGGFIAEMMARVDVGTRSVETGELKYVFVMPEAVVHWNVYYEGEDPRA